MQDNLARLELEASPVNRLSGLRSPSPMDQRLGTMSKPLPERKSSFQNLSIAAGQADNPPGDQPTFSPFPPLRNRPPNVPPSDGEKESILEKARTPVLNSDDPEMQLSWAQDTLAFVEIASQDETRASENQTARPQTPHIEHQLRVDAINIVSFLADQLHPKAEFLKGMWLEFGKFGFRVDKKEAFRCYQRAAQRGYARAEYRMGMQYEMSPEPDKAIKHYHLGVQAGDSASNYRLGMMTLLGQRGQTQDFSRGIKLISYAAETADENAPQGAYVFGMLQARDLAQIQLPEQYLQLNISGARFNIEKAAYLGFAKAQAKMGSAFELCQLGCDFNPALSLHYNALAAKQGEAEADMAISKWFLCGYDGVFEKDEGLAFTYAQRAAQSGLPTAEFAMGYFNEVGIHVQADLKTSRSWYLKAAEHGNKDAVGRIDGISRSKTLSRKDHENVAVAKIKSQYGSHRGRRPDRFKNPPTPMSPIEDEPIDMPEPSIPKQRLGESRPSPYPPSNGSAMRPNSAAPYPLDDGRAPPQPRPPKASDPPNSNARLSANIPPAPSSASSMASFPDRNYRGSAYPSFGPQASAIPPTASTGRGRGTPPQNLPGGLNSNGQYLGKQGPGGQASQELRKPSAGYASPHGPSSPAMNASRPHSTQPPPIDIGFSAPPDLSGADRQRRQQRIDQQNMRPPPASRPPSTNIQLSGSPDRMSRLAHPQTMPTGGRAPSPARRPMTAAGIPGASVQNSTQIRPEGSPESSHLPNIPPKLSNPNQPHPTPPPSVPTTKPPGKGPKTFQEMGVPMNKQESDCVSNASDLLHCFLLITNIDCHVMSRIYL